jgi:hypothetical protein
VGAARQPAALSHDPPENRRPEVRKAIELRVTLWIEAEVEPADDFSRTAVQAVHEIIADGGRTHPELQLTIKRIVER